jgi:uncharacterized membrane protein (UPF0127 family)
MALLWIFSIVFNTAVAAEKIFKTGDLKIAGKNLKVEIADSPMAREKGLMFRSKLAHDEGMLFIFDKEELLSFWMKNTFIPLSIGFFDSKKRLTEILDMDPVVSEIQSELPRYTSKQLSKYALEVNKDWFKKNNVKVGSEFSILKSKP